ncbi:hypothetical protein IW152_002609 [Coemansia sp. BCRC 34962]|nr:hypothetical protein IW152_002609 [Coemansia sp. BCRC 34962]
MDVINGTIRPRNTSLCHECITTVSSVWRSESRDAADAATSLAALGALDIKAAQKYLAGSSASNTNTYSDDDEEDDEDDVENSDDEDHVDYDGDCYGDANDGNGKDGGVLNRRFEGNASDK